MRSPRRGTAVRDHVHLTPLSTSDTDDIRRSLPEPNDLWRHTTHHEVPWSGRDVTEYLRRAEREHDSRQAWRLGIKVSRTRRGTVPRLVGVAELYRISWVHRSAYVGITVWNPTDRNNGYGKAAVSELIVLAFERLDLEKLSATVIKDNHASRQLFESSGFVHEGTMTAQVFIAGTRRDLLVYGFRRTHK